MKKNILTLIVIAGILLFSTASCKKSATITNTTPVVNAGRDTTILIPKNFVTLTATVTNDFHVKELRWRKISGPSSILMIDNNGFPYQKGLSARAIWLEEGAYEFELTAIVDNGPSIKDTVKVTITTQLRKYIVAGLRPAASGFIEIQLPDDVFRNLKWTFCRFSSRCEQADSGPAPGIDYSLGGGWYYTFLNNNKISVFGYNNDFDLLIYY